MNDILAASGKVSRALLINRLHSVLKQLELQLSELVSKGVPQLVHDDRVIHVLDGASNFETIVHGTQGYMSAKVRVYACDE